MYLRRLLNYCSHNCAIAACWLMLICSTANTAYGDLHAILIADTKEPTIGLSSQVDLYAMHNEVQTICMQTGLKLHQLTYSADQVQPENILADLGSLQINEDDVVIFYFSGHGFRHFTKSKDNPWPNLYFSLTDNSVDLAYFIDILSDKNPRLMLVLSDSCNNIIPDRLAPPQIRTLLSKERVSSTLQQNYKHLFLDTQGVIIAVASEAGKYSLADYRGGFFTRAFLKSLDESTHSFSTPSWQAIFERTAFQVLDESSSNTLPTQNPFYLIY